MPMPIAVRDPGILRAFPNMGAPEINAWINSSPLLPVLTVYTKTKFDEHSPLVQPLWTC